MGHGAARALPNREGCRSRRFSTSRTASTPRRSIRWSCTSTSLERRAQLHHAEAERRQRQRRRTTSSNGYVLLDAGHRLRRWSPRTELSLGGHPGAKAMIDSGFVDPKHIGLEGTRGVDTRARTSPLRRHVRRDCAGRAGGQHEQCLRRHPLGRAASTARCSTSARRAALGPRPGRGPISISRTRRSSTSTRSHAVAHHERTTTTARCHGTRGSRSTSRCGACSVRRTCSTTTTTDTA